MEIKVDLREKIKRLPLLAKVGLLFVSLAVFVVGFYLVQNGRQIKENFSEAGQLKIAKTALNKYSFKTLNNDLIEIGNSGQTSQPYLKLNKWDGEVFLNISFPNISGSKPNFDGEKLTFSNKAADTLKPLFASIGLVDAAPKMEVAFYPRQPEQISEKDASGNESVYTINEEGGVEFDTILYEKPESNEIFYPMQSKGLEFYYQPPLNQGEQSDGIECTETTCQNSDGKVVNYRPENVIGSYAVYYEGSKSGDYTEAGGKNYKIGKVFHIYRPSISDTNGKKVWGTLSINEKENQLSITVPQDFLDAAVYPINIDPIFGYSGIGASDCWLSGNYYRGSRVVTPIDSNGATISKISLYAKEDYSGTLNYKAAIANDNKKLISNGIGTGAVVGSSYSWIDSVFGTPPSIVDNSTYFLGVIADVGSSNLAVACDNGISDAVYLSATNSYSSPVDPTDGVVASTVRYSLYATYSGGTPAVIPGAHYLEYTASSTISSYALYNSATPLSSTKVFVAYAANNNPGPGMGIVATVSTSTAPVYGTAVSFSGTGTNGTSYISVAALDLTHVFVAYARDGLGNGRIATITGTTITYGPEYAFFSSSVNDIHVSKISSSSALISFNGGTSPSSTCMIANVSSNAISYGDFYPFTGHTNTGLGSAVLDSTHGMVVYQDFDGGGSYGRTLEITSTSTISYGPKYKIWDYQIFDVSITSLSATRAMVVYQRSAWPSNGVARIANISGTEINFSPDQIFAPNQEVSPSAVALDPDHVLIAYSNYENSIYSGVAIVATVSSNKIYFGAKYTFSSLNNRWYSPAVLSSKHAFIGYTYGGYGSGNKGIVTYLGDAPNMPTLISPPNGSTSVALLSAFQFSYSDPNAANGVKFDLQVSTSTDFSSLVINEVDHGGLWANSSTIIYDSSSYLSESTTYYWRARVASANGWSYWSEPNWFTTGINYPPNTPTLVSPGDGASGISLTPTLQFGYSDPNGENATQIQVMLDDNSDFSSPIIGGVFDPGYSNGNWPSGSVASYGISGADGYLSVNGHYYWKARVFDGISWSNWSDGTWHFTTTQPPSITSIFINTSNPNICKTEGSTTICKSGQNITFNSTASDPDGDLTKLFVCKNPACDNCGPNSTSSCWAYSAIGAAGNPSAIYDSVSAPACGSGETNCRYCANSEYWAKVCNSSVCSNIIGK